MKISAETGNSLVIKHSPSLYSYLSLEVDADLWMGGIATSTVGGAGCFFASSGLEFSRPESEWDEIRRFRGANYMKHFLKKLF